MTQALPAGPLRIAVIDDHPPVRIGLMTMLRAWEHCGDLFEAENGADYERKCLKRRAPHIVFVDLSMPVRDGFETIAWIRRTQVGTIPVAITFDPNPRSVERALGSGAKGVLDKTATSAEVIKAVEHLRAGGFYHNAIVQQHLERKAGDRGAHGPFRAVEAKFTKRELQFLEQLSAADDPSYDKVAERMGCSIHTVHTYRRNLFAKLGVQNRQGLYRTAMHWKLIRKPQ